MTTTTSNRTKRCLIRSKKNKRKEERNREIIERNQMIHAIHSLSSLSITQTKKFYIFKDKYEKAIEEENKWKDIAKEIEDTKHKFYDARAQYLKEKDIREELSEEVQYLARKNNILRKNKQKEIDSRQTVIDGIKETWVQFGEESKIIRKKNDRDHTEDEVSLENLKDDNIHLEDNHPMLQAHTISSQQGESTHEMESSTIKELETMITQLSYQLKLKDDHLNIILHHLNKSDGEESEAKVKK